HLALHSFPTRRSSDLLGITRHFRADVFPLVMGLPFGLWIGAGIPHFPLPAKLTMEVLEPIDLHAEVSRWLGRAPHEKDLENKIRSEEHTSELQSRGHL